MNPGLVGRGKLAAARRGRYVPRGALWAWIGLLVALVSLGVLPSAGSTPGAAGSATDVPRLGFVRGTSIPSPPSALGFVSVRVIRGPGKQVYAWRSAGLTASDATLLFDLYLESMLSEGWVLQEKVDPDATGRWSQGWARDDRTAHISLSPSPDAALRAETCPPKMYC